MGASNGITYSLQQIREIEILVEWTDKFGHGIKHFRNVYELADFLKHQPEAASRLGYVPKQK